MDLRYPRNSAELIAMRKSGNVSALPVLVTLAGPLPYANVTLSAHAGERYDWNPVRALDIEVFASASVPWDSLLRTLADIAAIVPNTLVLTFREGPRIHCGETRTVPGQDFALFDWFPMPVETTRWAASRTLARRLLAALGDMLPNPYDRACELAIELLVEQNATVTEVA